MDTFIRFRLKAAKANPDLFSREAIKLIELDSKSNRRVIMNLAVIRPRRARGGR